MTTETTGRERSSQAAVYSGPLPNVEEAGIRLEFVNAEYSRSKPRRGLCFMLSLCAALLLITNGTKSAGLALQAQATAASPPSPEAAQQNAGQAALPLNFKRNTGDLDEMLKRRTIRAIVILDPIGFFYENGLPKGIMYEALQAFQAFVNQKLKTGAIKVEVTFLPLQESQTEAALMEGMGDLIAYGVIMTPEREQQVAFSIPIEKDVTQIIVTGKQYAAVSSFADLGGKEVYVNPLTVDQAGLQKVNDSLQKAGKAPIAIKVADKNLTEDDLIQMVNAGLIPATVTRTQRAELWTQVLPNLKLHPELVVASGIQLGWVMRKNNPQLKQLVDEFATTHAAGTSFGNTLLRRYLINADWVKNSTSKQEIEKFQALVAIFQKYGQQYGFDYLMLAAQGYQESMLEQNRRSPGGAVGIMQVMPRDAAAPPISISNVLTAEGNIHAAAKMLRHIADTYFNDPNIDAVNRTLFVFASYNAGPNRIAELRQKAKEQGLNPNVWFGNVELIAARDIGEVTVMYVSNIYKYYVAYQLALEQAKVELK